MYHKNHPVEGLRIYLRLLYCIFIWYEFVLWPEQLDMTNDQLTTKGNLNKIPLWLGASACFFFGLMERCCSNGTRLMTMSGYGLFFWIHLVLYTLPIEGRTFKIVINVVLDVMFLNSFNNWATYGESNMESYRCHGQYKVGFKRFKSEKGNDCIVLYPVDSYSAIPREISPYINVERKVKGVQKAGAPSGYAGSLRARKIANVCPDADISRDFQTGKKLIPYIHCHGFGTSADEHIAIPMQFASYGYFCIIPDFMDHSAPWTTNKAGNDIFYLMKDTPMSLKDGHNPELFEFWKNCNTQRKEEVQNIGQEVCDEGFLESFGFGSKAQFDLSKFTISGHGLGGLTSIMASEGDQTIFKACLSHDAAVSFYNQEVEEDTIRLNIPTQTIHSTGFVDGMQSFAFKYKKGMKDVLKFSDNINARIGASKHESMVLEGLGHFDTSDRYLYDQYLMQIDNSAFGADSVKSQGSHSELHEATALWQIEYLYKIGFCDMKQEEVEKIRDLLNVWDPIVKYISPLSDDLEGNQVLPYEKEENFQATCCGSFSIPTAVKLLIPVTILGMLLSLVYIGLAAYNYHTGGGGTGLIILVCIVTAGQLLSLMFDIFALYVFIPYSNQKGENNDADFIRQKLINGVDYLLSRDICMNLINCAAYLYVGLAHPKGEQDKTWGLWWFGFHLFAFVGSFPLSIWWKQSLTQHYKNNRDFFHDYRFDNEEKQWWFREQPKKVDGDSAADAQPKEAIVELADNSSRNLIDKTEPIASLAEALQETPEEKPAEVAEQKPEVVADDEGDKEPKVEINHGAIYNL